ncbi:unnamed protein product [Caenorhabditis brenneri]
MVIHYLQQVSVLPNLQAEFPELNGEIKIEADESERRDLKKELESRGYKLNKNKDSLAALYWGFFKYFKEFDFKTHWISVKRGTLVEKEIVEEGQEMTHVCNEAFIGIEDPFLEKPWNCARTVRQGDITERIMEEFQRGYDLIEERNTIFRNQSIRRVLIVKEGKARDLMDVKVINRLKDCRYLKSNPREFYEASPRRENEKRWPEPMQLLPL